MSLTKQGDVKKHLSSRHRTQIHVFQPQSQPDATGFSAAEPDAFKANPSIFAEDFVAEHSSPGIDPAQGNPLMGSLGPQAPTASKSVQL